MHGTSSMAWDQMAPCCVSLASLFPPVLLCSVFKCRFKCRGLTVVWTLLLCGQYFCVLCGRAIASQSSASIAAGFYYCSLSAEYMELEVHSIEVIVTVLRWCPHILVTDPTDFTDVVCAAADKTGRSSNRQQKRETLSNRWVDRIFTLTVHMYGHGRHTFEAVDFWWGWAHLASLTYSCACFSMLSTCMDSPTAVGWAWGGARQALLANQLSHDTG